MAQEDTDGDRPHDDAAAVAPPDASPAAPAPPLAAGSSPTLGTHLVAAGKGSARVPDDPGGTSLATRFEANAGEGFRNTLTGQKIDENNSGQLESEQGKSLLGFAAAQREQGSPGTETMMIPTGGHEGFAPITVADAETQGKALVQAGQQKAAAYAQTLAGRAAEDKAVEPWSSEPTIGGKLAAGASALAGQIVGGSLSPEMLLGGVGARGLRAGEAVLPWLAKQTGLAAANNAAIAGGTDTSGQIGRMERGEQQDFSPAQVAQSAGTGALIGGLLHVAPHVAAHVADVVAPVASPEFRAGVSTLEQLGGMQPGEAAAKAGVAPDQAPQAAPLPAPPETNANAPASAPTPPPASAVPETGPMVRPQNATPEAQNATPPVAPVAAAPFSMFRPSDLTVDPERFQYKASDEKGVTGALSGVKRWEPALADPITVWQGGDGGNYVVNGHQRTDLASRAEAAGQTDVQIPARVYREADGYTPQDMRTLGAYQNIAQGSGTAVDAAKVLRGQAAAPSAFTLPELPPRQAIVQQARGLANLSPEAFGAVVNDVVPAAYAAEVGHAIPDPQQQMAALGVLAKSPPANAEQARFMVQDIRNSGFLSNTQDSLFGNEAFAQSLFSERARVLNTALQALRRNKTVFRAAVDGEDTLGAAGNQMNREGNEQGKADNDQLIDTLQRDATTRGPLSDALSDAARNVASGRPASAAANDFLAAARRIPRGSERVAMEPRAGDDGAGSPGPSGSADPALEPHDVEEQDALFSARSDQPNDNVRFYHGSKGVDPTSGGARWVTSDPIYARDFRSDGTANDLHYVDLPRDHPLVANNELEGTPGHYAHFEVPPDIAGQMKPFAFPPERTVVGPPSQVRAQMGDLMRATMRYAGLPQDVGLRLVDRLSDAATGKGADGAYTHKLVTFALDTPADQVPAKLFHEVVHGLLDPKLGLVGPEARRALEIGADRYLKQGDNRAQIEAAYGADPALVREEAIARMAEQVVQDTKAYAPLAGRVAARMQNFVRGVGQALRGEGFTTADDVFRSITRGRLSGEAERIALASTARDAWDRSEMPAQPGAAVPGAGAPEGDEGALFSKRRDDPRQNDLLGKPAPRERQAAPAQVDMFGTGDAALQAQAARDQAGRGALLASGPQKAPDEGLFAPDMRGQGDMLGKPAEVPHGQPARDMADEVVRLGKQTGTEHLRTYDPLQDKITDRNTGQKSFVAFTPEMAKAFRDPANALVIQHNHPGSSSLSDADIAALGEPGVSHVVAHAHDGNLFAASLSPEQSARLPTDPGRRFNALANIYHVAEARMTETLGSMLRAGTIALDTANAAYHDLINRALHYADHTSYITSRPLDEQFRGAVETAGQRINDGRPSTAPDGGHAVAVRPDEGLARVIADARRTAEQKRSGVAGGPAAEANDQGSPVRPGPGRQPLATPPADAGGQRRLFSLRDDRPPAERERSVQQLQIAFSSPKPAGQIAKMADTIAKIFSPTSRGNSATSMEALIRRNAAEGARSYAQVVHALTDMRDAIGRLPVEEQHAFTDRMEAGQAQPTPQLQAIADALRKNYNQWTDRIRSLGTGQLQNARENYMAHIWANHEEWSNAQVPRKPDGTPLTHEEIQEAAQARSGASGQSKAPIRGSGAFLKQRSFETQAEGMAAGLVPVSDNPVNMAMIKLREVQKYYWGTRMANEIKSVGLARWVGEADKFDAARAGMVKMDDRVFNPTTPMPEGTMIHGAWWAPEAAARIFNNYVSKGIADDPIYGALRAGNNALNMLQLGISGFHATFITQDTIISRGALGLEQAARGDFGKAARTIASLPVAPITTVARGQALRKAILMPEGATPEMRKIADMAVAGGARTQMGIFYQATGSGAFVKGLKDLSANHIWQEVAGTWKDSVKLAGITGKAGAVPLAAFHLATRAIETISEPLMGALVPRAKLGVFYELAHDWTQANPDATPEATSAAMTRFWDSVDNRMGQMVYDNLFWNKTMKDIAHVATRSVGWNIGTLREIGGAAVDTAMQAGRAAQGKAPSLTSRMAYTIMMPAVVATEGAIMTYLMTGRAPQQSLDYFYPPDAKGNRLSIPGYIKDVIDWTHAPGQTFFNKMSPLASTAQQIYNNRDYYGGIIRDPQRDNAATAYMEYLLNQTMPFSIRSLQKESRSGATPLEEVLAFWGFQPAPAGIVNPGRNQAFEDKANRTAYRKRERESDRVEIPWLH